MKKKPAKNYQKFRKNAKIVDKPGKKVQNIEITVTNRQKCRTTGKTVDKLVKNHQKYRKNGNTFEKPGKKREKYQKTGKKV